MINLVYNTDISSRQTGQIWRRVGDSLYIATATTDLVKLIDGSVVNAADVGNHNWEQVALGLSIGE